jgi:DMSO/TMAO reductase YedYZ molybdopterin-dependent catalytic subunit
VDTTLKRSHNRTTPQPHTYKLGRSAFLGLLGLTAGALLIGKKAGAVFNFIPGPTSVDGFTIYTVTNGYPSFDPQGYRLTIDGMANNPISMTLSDILQHPSVTETKYYQCVTGWIVPHPTWTGIRLSSLLDKVKPHANAHAVKFYSFDGAYTESLTMDQARQSDVLLAYKLNGKPLSRAQGAPLRLVVPGMYGYKFIKWVNRVELIPEPIQGYWEQNGYDRDAYIGRSNGQSSAPGLDTSYPTGSGSASNSG